MKKLSPLPIIGRTFICQTGRGRWEARFNRTDILVYNDQGKRVFERKADGTYLEGDELRSFMKLFTFVTKVLKVEKYGVPTLATVRTDEYTGQSGGIADGYEAGKDVAADAMSARVQ